MKFAGVSVPQVPKVEVVCSRAVNKKWKGTTDAAGAAETVDSGDVPGLEKKNVLRWWS